VARTSSRLLAAALLYPLALRVTTWVLAAQPTARQRAWLDYASTSLDNLADHPVPAMVLSAVLTDGEVWPWVALAAVGVWAAGRQLGGLTVLGLAFAVHVLATAVSQGLVAYRIAAGALPPSARQLLDVGPSYLVTAALVMGAAFGYRWLRLASALGLGVLLPTLLDGLTSLEVSAVGHVASMVLGLVLGWTASRWRPDKGPGPAAGVPGRGLGWPSADSNREPG
jgi:hypothetical protein